MASEIILGNPLGWAQVRLLGGWRRISFTVGAYAGAVLLFGPETRGLPPTLLAGLPRDRVVRLPMVPGGRSLNLANAVAVAVFEAWRQHAYAGDRGA